MAVALAILNDEGFGGEDINLREPLERVYNVRLDAFELTDRAFRVKFRLPINICRDLIDGLVGHLEGQTRRSSIPPGVRVLTALRFFARGSHQVDVGDSVLLALSQPSVSRSINSVARAIETLMPQWVKFPQTEAEKQEVKQGFMAANHFPGVIGALDCTHVAIVAPKENDPLYPEHIYVNRKNYHSINVQLVCDANERILNVNARYPGRTHDAFIFNHSRLKEMLEAGNDMNSWLVSDSGYRQATYNLTPFLNAAAGSPEENYNRAHAATRCVIERCNGLLKARWRCLLKYRTLHYKPTVASRIIHACVVLHNMCRRHNVGLIRGDDELMEDEDLEINVNEPVLENLQGHNLAAAVAAGNRQRARVVRNYFAR